MIKIKQPFNKGTTAIAECPFFNSYQELIDCPHMLEHGICSNIEINPGKEDSWCGKKIEASVNDKKIEASVNDQKQVRPFPTLRQNYMCNICGLKSFVTYHSQEDGFAVAIKIGNNHEAKEPTCPCGLDELIIVGKPTTILPSKRSV